MNIKTRILKLEAKKIDDKNIVVIFIDGICTYEDKQYTYDEFYKLYPDFKNAICVEIE